MADGERADYILNGPPLKYVARYTSMGKFIFDCLKKDPEFIGQIEAHTGHKYTFAEILDRSIRLALWFRDMGIRSGDVVAYLTSNHKDVIIVVYATLFVGAVLTPWYHLQPTHEIADFMDRTKPKIVICSKDAAISVKTAAEKSHIANVLLVHGEVLGFISFEDTQIHSRTNIDNFKCAEVAENDVAFLVCTSGTTGSPKFMSRTHKSTLLITQVNSAVITSLMCLQMIYCDAISNHDISSLLQVVVAGVPILGPWQYAKFKEVVTAGCKLLVVYGLTEMAGVMSTTSGADKPGSCGSLLEGVSAKIIDPHTGNAISPHELGELCLKHPGMFVGYYDDPVSTESVLDSDGWFHTGDLARFDEDGDLFLIDRLKDMIDVNGVKVSPAELEAILGKHPGVEHVGVVGKRVSSDEEHPVAFVARTLGSNVTEAEICDFLKTQAADDAKQLRGGVRFINKVPRSVSGKVKRFELRKMLESET